TAEPALGKDLEHFKNRSRQATARDLHPSLLANPNVGIGGAVGRMLLQRQWQRGELRDRWRRPDVQLLALLFGDAGDQRQMIVPSPPRVTLRPPAADVAVRIGFGIRAAVG